MVKRIQLSPEVEAEIHGLEELTQDMEKAVAELPSGLESAMGKATLLVEREAKIKASGRPGPMVRTGRLRASIAPEVETVAGGVRGIVGSVVEYAPYVELGTKKSRAYPYLGPAVEAKTEQILKILGDFTSEIVTKIDKG